MFTLSQHPNQELPVEGSLFGLWRDPEADPALLASLHRALSRVTMLNEPRWAEALAGDAAAACGLAIEAVRTGRSDLARDLVLSVLLLHAIGGDGAAVVVLDLARRNAGIGGNTAEAVR